MTSVEEPQMLKNPVVKFPAHRQNVRHWTKFGACANATGPERGITMNCDRRPVEFNWSDISNRIFAAENTRQMKHEWEMYVSKQVLPKLRGRAAGSLKEVVDKSVKLGASHTTNTLPSESVAARSEQHSQVGESTSPIASSPVPADSRNTRNKHGQHMSMVKGPALMEHKLGLSGFASTLHTDAAEFIPKANHAPLGTTQPVQWLNNDVQKLNEHPFQLPDQSNGSEPQSHSGEHPNNRPFTMDAGRSNFYNESRDTPANGSAPSQPPSAQPQDERSTQLLNMKAKLKGHYRLLYSKYKEYVAKRVPEKVEEYYIRLKHCQAQYMKLKYYEYKAHAVAPKPRSNNSSNLMNGPSGASPSQRPGRGGVVPPNNPWQTGSQQNMSGSTGLPAGGFGDYLGASGGVGGGASAWGDSDAAKNSWQQRESQPEYQSEQWREQRDYASGQQSSQSAQGTYAGFGGSMNGNGSMWGDGYREKQLQFARQQRQQQQAANANGGGYSYGQQSPDQRLGYGSRTQHHQHASHGTPQRF